MAMQTSAYMHAHANIKRAVTRSANSSKHLKLQ